MGGVSLGLKLGFVHFGNADLPGSEGAAGSALGIYRIDSRNNFKLVLPFNFGGGGVGLDLHPAIAFGDITTVSVYLGLSIEIHLTRNTYLGLGFGPDVGYWLDDAVVLGLDAYFRVPLRFHYYLADDLGLFGEFGFGFGGSGVQYKPVGGLTPDLKFGTTTVIDFGVGVRFP
jgi:hypothetical protein